MVDVAVVDVVADEPLPKWAIQLLQRQDAIEERVSRLESSAQDLQPQHEEDKQGDPEVMPRLHRIEQILGDLEHKVQGLLSDDCPQDRSPQQPASQPLPGAGSEVDRLGAAMSALSRETKAAESAIAQALKLLQAQVTSKATRTELQHGLSRAMDAAFDAQERSRAVASSLVSLANDVDARAPLQALARLEHMVHSQVTGGVGGAPILSAKRITTDHRDSHPQPSLCLSCKQPLPLAASAPLSHDVLYHPSSPGGRAGDLASQGAPDGKAFQTIGSACRDGTRSDPSRTAKQLYGAPPANETRKRTALQLQMLAANSATTPGPTRAGSAKSERGRPIEAIIGQARPTSAAALLPGQKRPMNASASTSSLLAASGGGVASTRMVPLGR